MVLEITEVQANKTYSINGAYSGSPLYAEALDSDTIGLTSKYTARTNQYKTKSAFIDFLIGGVNPTDVDNAVELINAITNFSVAGGAALPTDINYVDATGAINSSTGAGDVIPIMSGDTGSGGVRGLVPDQTTGDSDKFLKGDGTWGSQSSGSEGDIQIKEGENLGTVPNQGFNYDSLGKNINLSQTGIVTSDYIDGANVLTNDFEDNNIAPFTTFNIPPIVPPWIASTNNPYEGTYCAESGIPSVGFSSIMQYNYTATKLSQIKLFVRTSCDSSQTFTVVINGQEVLNINGSVGSWVEYGPFQATEGPVILNMNYNKNTSTVLGDDKVYVDLVTINEVDESVELNGLSKINGILDINGDFNTFGNVNIGGENNTVNIDGSGTGNTTNLTSVNLIQSIVFQANIQGSTQMSGIFTTEVKFAEGIVIERTGGIGNYIGNGTGITNPFTNTLYGSEDSGKSLTTGTGNTGIGWNVYEGLTTGTGNVAIGNRSMELSTDANYNIGIGHRALDSVDGDGNISLGYVAGHDTVGDNNIIRNSGQTIVNIGTLSNHIRDYVNGVLKFEINDNDEATLPQTTTSKIISGGSKSILIKEYFEGETALTDAANISWNAESNPRAFVTLTANRILDNPTNLIAGKVYSIRVVQGGTGSYTLTFGANYVTKDDSTVAYTKTLSTAVGSFTTIQFYTDGTNMIGL